MPDISAMDDAATAEALIKGIRTGRRVDDDERDADDNERINRDDMEGLLDVYESTRFLGTSRFVDIFSAFRTRSTTILHILSLSLCKTLTITSIPERSSQN